MIASGYHNSEGFPPQISMGYVGDTAAHDHPDTLSGISTSFLQRFEPFHTLLEQVLIAVRAVCNL